MRAVSSPSVPQKPSYAVRLLLPFIRLLSQNPAVPREVLEPLLTVDPDERFPIAQVHELLEGALVLTGDPDLGLKAAREIVRGEYGAMEYAARSAATWGESVEVVARYMRLVNDALRFEVQRLDGQPLLGRVQACDGGWCGRACQSGGRAGIRRRNEIGG